LLTAWQLKPKAVITWPMDYAGRGIGPKGKPSISSLQRAESTQSTLSDQTTPLKRPFHLVRKGAHSAKPIEAYVYFESLYPRAADFKTRAVRDHGVDADRFNRLDQAVRSRV
jgi:hypothetical protein